MLTFVTMAMDIGKHSPDELRAVFRLLYNSLRLHHSEFRLYCYTNIQPKLFSAPMVSFIPLDECDLEAAYSDRWLNLSFNRRALVSRHLETRPIWIDLDTIVCADLRVVDPFPNFVVRYNLPAERKLSFLGHQISGRDYMLGHFWRLDRHLDEALLRLANESVIRPPHDIQDYFSILYARDPAALAVVNDFVPGIFNWEWSFGHPFPDRMADSVRLQNGRLHAAGRKHFAIMTFTFPSLLANLELGWSTVRDPGARQYLLELTNSSVDADLSSLRNG